MASAGYYAYSECADKEPLSVDQVPSLGTHNKESLSADQLAFLEARKTEIEQMYEHRAPAGSWTMLGKGVSKMTFVHPDLPEMLIKLPTNPIGFRGATGEDDLRLHYTNLEQIRSIAAPFSRIALPESHLYPTSKGLVIVEQRFDLVDYFTIPNDPEKEEMMNQFDAFKEASDLCDVFPIVSHNAGILSQTTPPKIGVIDFDCRNQQIGLGLKWGRGMWDWSFKNPRSQFFVLPNRNQIGALALAAGATLLGGVSAIAKKISKITSTAILGLGFGAGTMAAAFLATKDSMDQPAAITMGAGALMAATAVVSIDTAKARSWLRGRSYP